MKKNIYLIILTVVTVFCIIFGSCYHIIGWGVKFINKFLPIVNSKNVVEWTETDSGDIQLDAFTAVSVDANVMSLTIRSGEQTAISYSYSNNLEPQFEVKDDTLVITQKNAKYKHFSKNKCSVTLTVPSDISYSKIDIDLAVGDIDIKDLSGEDLRVSANVGDLDLTNLSFNKIELETNVSDVDIENCFFDRLDVDANVGDIDVESTEDLSDYSIDLSAGIGAVTVNDKSHRREFSQNGTSGKSITIETDTGDIDLDYK